MLLASPKVVQSLLNADKDTKTMFKVPVPPPLVSLSTSVLRWSSRLPLSERPVVPRICDTQAELEGSKNDGTESAQAVLVAWLH
jgi:hypothetical protein